MAKGEEGGIEEDGQIGDAHARSDTGSGIREADRPKVTPNRPFLKARKNESIIID
jgi:hypothetical protein